MYTPSCMKMLQKCWIQKHNHLRGSQQAWRDFLKPKFTLETITIGHKTAAWLPIYEMHACNIPFLYLHAVEKAFKHIYVHKALHLLKEAGNQQANGQMLLQNCKPPTKLFRFFAILTHMSTFTFVYKCMLHV